MIRLFLNSLLISSTVVRLYSEEFGIVFVVIQLKVQKFLNYLVASECPFLDTKSKFDFKKSDQTLVWSTSFFLCLNLLDIRNASDMVNFIFDCYRSMAVSFFEEIRSCGPLESSFCFLTNVNWWPCWTVTTWKLMFNIKYLMVMNLWKIKPTLIERI